MKGESLLKEAEKVFEVTQEVTIGLDIEENMKYISTAPVIFGFVTPLDPCTKANQYQSCSR